MKITPDYNKMNDWDVYHRLLSYERRQCADEGIDIASFADRFDEIEKLSADEEKVVLADSLFDDLSSANAADGYPYSEPSDYDGIVSLSKVRDDVSPLPSDYDEKLRGALRGRMAGCLLGKPIEGMKNYELRPFLKDTGNFPVYRYVSESDIDLYGGKYSFEFKERAFPETTGGFGPVDDDTNYTVLGAVLIDRFGRDFKPCDVLENWINMQSLNSYFTAERIAYRNYIGGYFPPKSAVYKNPCREWIGARIRVDYYGYINPGDPKSAAEMAWRDASVSHTKNGIYGAMFTAAMIAKAAVCDDIGEIIKTGLGVIPENCRLAEGVREIMKMHSDGKTADDCFDLIYSRFDDRDYHDWCHDISNDMIVTTALLYGGGKFGDSICLAVGAGFDTDCNGATVGSILGMAFGESSIGEEWKKPVEKGLRTSIFGYSEVSLESLAEKVKSHLSR